MAGVGVLALVADGRFPVGGHAHSGGLEAAAAAYPLKEAAALEDFVRARVATVGATEANLIAVLMHGLETGDLDWATADAEIDARIASPALRAVSRMLGRQWIRAGRQVFAGSHADRAGLVHQDGPHQVMAYAAVVVDAGIEAAEAVGLHLHHFVSTITTAAVRLHGTDPYEVARLQVDVHSQCETVVADALVNAGQPWEKVPAPAAPLADILAEHHAVADMRLFRS